MTQSGDVLICMTLRNVVQNTQATKYSEITDIALVNDDNTIL